MIIWTPADSGRGGGVRMAQTAHFSESTVRSPVLAKTGSADVMVIDGPRSPCQPRAIADEEWCSLGESSLPAGA
ncbi:MAG: hypothetical protein QGF53_02880 [Alphaproteobacteria bacterium]|jgi:hypothetical protein|nr:hypothetical protein [Alphaproteobacteria bacterium]